MYITTELELDTDAGTETFEVGADVDPECHGVYEVGEPDISAPGCSLRSSRAVLADPSVLDDDFPGSRLGIILADGWSDDVKDALIVAYEGHLDSRYDDGIPDEDRHWSREDM